MKFIIPLLALSLAFVSCKKDEVDPTVESEGLFTPTNTSFSELDLSQSNNTDLFIANLNVENDANGLLLDLNSDGTDDLRIVGVADQDWFGTTSVSSSNLSIVALNSNTFVLRDSIADSTFNLSTADTFNFIVDDYQLISSYQQSGSVFSSETMNSYIAHVDSTATLMANDPRWAYASSAQVVRDHNASASTFEYGPDADGYTHYIEDNTDYKRGIVPNQIISWIPIKFVTDEGNVKLGYIKVKPALSNGFISVGVAGWAIQR